MSYFYDYYLNQKFTVSSALKTAKDKLKNLTIGEMRSNWLTSENIANIGAYSQNIQAHLQQLTLKKDNYKPYNHPFYWSAFIHLGI